MIDLLDDEFPEFVPPAVPRGATKTYEDMLSLSGRCPCGIVIGPPCRACGAQWCPYCEFHQGKCTTKSRRERIFGPSKPPFTESDKKAFLHLYRSGMTSGHELCRLFQIGNYRLKELLAGEVKRSGQYGSEHRRAFDGGA